MTGLCLDTNAYCRFCAGHAPLLEMLESADEIVVPTIVIGELEAGFALGSRQEQNRRRLQQFLAAPGVRTASPDVGAAERYGVLVACLKRQGTPLPTNDIWVAATAMESGLRLCTYDRHFEAVPGLLCVAP